MTKAGQMGKQLSKAERKAADRAARRAQRLAEQKRLSAAAQAENWTDRDGKARPTPERRAKGAFVLRDGEDAGVTVAVDEACTELDRLRRRGILTDEQAQGGHDLAALLERTRLTAPGRSCLDISPVGFDDSEPSHGELRDARERAELYLSCGVLTWRELRRVCHEGLAPRSLIRLREGLDICARYWGLRAAQK